MHLTRQKPGKKKPYRFFRSDRAKTWQRPTFPGDPSIIGAGELNYRVRYGNGCDLSAIATRVKITLNDLCSEGPTTRLTIEEIFLN